MSILRLSFFNPSLTRCSGEAKHWRLIYLSADASGVPLRPALLKASRGKSPDGTVKTRMATLGCVITQH